MMKKRPHARGCTCLSCVYDKRVARRDARPKKPPATTEPAVAGGYDTSWAVDAIARRMERS